MPGKVIRFSDYEQRSRNPDAVHRDPAHDAIIIILPVIRVEHFDLEPAHARRIEITERR